MGCNSKDKKVSPFQSPSAIETNSLSADALEVRDLVKKDIVIAHRGSTYWAPETSEAAYRWARNIGADYLELDLQMTKDSVLVATHDNTILRTSNVRELFPKISKPTTNDFTLKELRSLDFGLWFNKAHPERARDGFINSKILTFQDVIMIAEGYRIKKSDNGEPVKEIVEGEWSGKYLYEKDPHDNNNRPGIYAETKKLHLEELLLMELTEYAWLYTDNPKNIKTYENKVSIANTDSRFVLQSFYKKSMLKLEKHLPKVPKCLLIWRPEMEGDIKNSYVEMINFCVENNVQIMGPSISGEPNNYEELSDPWMLELIHRSGMIVHPYTFDTNVHLDGYTNSVDGVFTNRADLALIYYKRLKENISEEILDELGY